MPDLRDIQESRHWAINEFRYWKDQIKVNDAIADDDWSVVIDGWSEESEPLIENLYSQAVEDKSLTAGALMPKLSVPALRGTRQDRAEKSAQRRRRVLMSHWERSNLRGVLTSYYMDLYHVGAVYTMPTTDWRAPDGRLLAPRERFPYIARLDGRGAFPLGHDNKGNLTSFLHITRRRRVEMEKLWGKTNPGLAALASRRVGRAISEGAWLEEIWYYDTTKMAVAVADPDLAMFGDDRNRTSLDWLELGSVAAEWLMPPEDHGLFACPVAEAKWPTFDGRYRTPLQDIIPQLKIANSFQRRLLDDLDQNIFAATVLQNIQNPEDYGPGAVLLGNGQGNANIIRDRPPVNFEAQQTVRQLVDGARRTAAQPAQRAGDPQASIVSAKGTNALLGTFNMELATSQNVMSNMLQRATALVANFDETHCAPKDPNAPGTKIVMGFDEGSDFEEAYDPRQVFAGDYRNQVSYGDQTGLDAQQHLTMIATLKNLEGMSNRTFMARSNMIDNPLQEERDMAIESLTNLFLQGILPQEIANGSKSAIVNFVNKIDSDKMTTREAVLATIREMEPPAPPPGASGAGGPPGGGGPQDIVKMLRSFSSGGIPGNAEGLPQGGGPPGLPSPVRRQLSETAPGGTAA